MNRRLGSLRSRLTVAVIAAAAVGLVALSAVTLRSVRADLVDQIDTQLRAERLVIIPPGAPERPDTAEPSGRENFDRPSATVLAVNRDGDIVDSNPRGVADRRDRPILTRKLLDGDANTAVTLDAEDGSTRYRAIVGDVPGGRGRLVLMLDLADVDQTVGGLQNTFLIAGGALLLALLVVISLLVRHNLRPLDEMVAEAERVAEGERERRVPEDGPTEVATLGTALNAMLSSIEESESRRDEVIESLRRFIGDASHELRTPIATVQGYAELLGNPDLDADERADAAERIDRTAARMAHQVENLLVLARLDEAGTRTRRTVDLAGLAERAVTDLRVVAPDHSIDVDVPDQPVRVWGDDEQLRRSVDNLLTNATRHTPAGASIVVAVVSDGADAVITVDDDGPGIPAEERERVFDRFHRTPDGRTRAGSGLGLAIVASIARDHAGSAVAEVSPMGGARFVVRLPLQPSTTGSGTPAR